MAITFMKGKKPEYSGIDKVAHAFGSGLEKIKSGAKRVASRPKRAAAAKRKGDARKEIESIERSFGTMDNYVQQNPSFRSRADRLRKEAGY
jgi:hypothetical protein